MADDNNAPSEETLKLAALGRGEGDPDPVTADPDPAQGGSDPDPAADEIPDYVPEKFRKDGKADYESLAKAYAELEKKLSAPKTKETDDGSDDDGAGDGDGADGDDGGDPDGAAADGGSALSAELFSTAEAEWADAGELTADTREKIIKSGIPEATLDTYLAGVKALSDALTASVHEAAGGEEAYNAAIKWAAEAWPASKIEKFDASLADGDLMPTMVTALMAEYTKANPGEGSLTQPGGGAPSGDVYHDAEEFTRDLQEADLKNDAMARRKAVQKLERSKKAGTLKHVTPRSGVSQLLG